MVPILFEDIKKTIFFFYAQGRGSKNRACDTPLNFEMYMHTNQSIYS